jgi:hypothetical protein
LNPVIIPDSMTYYWSPTTPWSDFRDPFLFYRDGNWNMLMTTLLRVGGYPGTGIGIIQRSTSNDLVHWNDAGVFFENNGDYPDHVLESSQYHQRGNWHHLYFAEYDVYGISHLSSQTFGAWDMPYRTIIDWGGAPEINQFDTGIDILGRIAAMQIPATSEITYVVRFDTLTYSPDGSTPEVLFPHPLEANWAEHTGSATLGNPTFGDNTAARGEDSCGLVGHGWFGSKEYFQGPLSGRGSPGTMLGDFATGSLTSHPFYITGDVIDMLVGGGYYPATCYIALVDAETDSILLKETGYGEELMLPVRWNVADYQGRLVYIQIVDAETGPDGHINVDEIKEGILHVNAVPPTPAALLTSYSASPNPSNPTTVIRFDLARTGRVAVKIHDLRGRVIWKSETENRAAGPHALTWRGRDRKGLFVPTGIYLFSIQVEGQVAGSGKITVVK